MTESQVVYLLTGMLVLFALRADWLKAIRNRLFPTLASSLDDELDAVLAKISAADALAKSGKARADRLAAVKAAALAPSAAPAPN